MTRRRSSALERAGIQTGETLGEAFTSWNKYSIPISASGATTRRLLGGSALGTRKLMHSGQLSSPSHVPCRVSAVQPNGLGNTLAGSADSPVGLTRQLHRCFTKTALRAQLRQSGSAATRACAADSRLRAGDKQEGSTWRFPQVKSFV